MPTKKKAKKVKAGARRVFRVGDFVRPKTKRGRCYMCGCTDDQACDGGCEWANKNHTLCSRCEQACFRVTDKHSLEVGGIPMFGLWCVDGGPHSRGHWVMDTGAGDCNEHPATFYDRKLALAAAAAENDHAGMGLGAMGWHVMVVELCRKPDRTEAANAAAAQKRKASRRSRR